jgi:predicted enzyme related to lactoylglutathione lyase
MTSVFRNITIDCRDAAALGDFWAQVLGWYVFTDDDPEVLVAPTFPYIAAVPRMLFIPVPEGKTAKNRLHLDLTPVNTTRDEEVARLQSLGATMVEDHRNDDGSGWAYLADPEGNEFCVERSDAERGADPVRRYRIVEDQ